MSEASVVYRTGPLTELDYSEAIVALRSARLVVMGVTSEAGGCAVCGDAHGAAECHHNPLIMARRGVEATRKERWRCFHCGDVFSTEEELLAEEHFGRSEEEAARCVVAKVLRDYEDRLVAVFSEMNLNTRVVTKADAEDVLRRAMDKARPSELTPTEAPAT